jgi:hypothetical protein
VLQFYNQAVVPRLKDLSADDIFPGMDMAVPMQLEAPADGESQCAPLAAAGAEAVDKPAQRRLRGIAAAPTASQEPGPGADATTSTRSVFAKLNGSETKKKRNPLGDISKNTVHT